MRSLIASFSALLLAGAASAATLTVTPDKLVYDVGETITLTVLGNAEGAVAYTMYGRLLYDASLADPGTTMQNSGGTPPWIQGPLAQGDGFAESFNQVEGAFSAQAANFPGDVVSVVTLIAEAIGVVEVSWDTTGSAALSFFGITDAPGTSFTIVPEPATGALFSLGLFAFTIRHRRRSRKCVH